MIFLGRLGVVVLAKMEKKNAGQAADGSLLHHRQPNLLAHTHIYTHTLTHTHNKASSSQSSNSSQQGAKETVGQIHFSLVALSP